MYAVKFPKNIQKKLQALNEMGIDNEVFVDKLEESLAREYKKQLLRHIENQDFNWKELSPDYLKYKQEKGLFEKIWKSTGLLKESIEVFKTEQGTWFAGIQGNAKYPDGTSIPMVALVHEFGSPSRGIPARPLFRRTRQVMLKNINKFVRTENKKHIKYLVNKINKIK